MPAALLITKIEPQKNRPHRKSVYLDGKFAFGADEELIREFELEEEKKLSQRELKQILWSVDRSKLKERAIRLLSIRPRSEEELKEKLRQKGAGVRLIEEVVRELKEKDLLDDEKFAYSWVESRMLNKPMGKFLLKRELKAKGVKAEIIERVIAENYQQEDELELAKKLLQRKARRFKDTDDLKTKKRMTDFLLRRGFSYEVVRQAVKGLEEYLE
jgi:regulatory protein